MLRSKVRISCDICVTMDLYDVISVIKWRSDSFKVTGVSVKDSTQVELEFHKKEGSFALADVARCCFQLELWSLLKRELH